MASDLHGRRQALVEDLPAESPLSLARLSRILGASEVEVREAFQSLGLAVPRATSGMEQTVHGTANAQFGSHNAQLNIQGPLVQVQAEPAGLPGAGELRSLMADRDALHDALNHHLLQHRSRRVLSAVLAVSAEQPAWELLFHEWVQDTPDLHAQHWFVKATVSEFAQDLSEQAAARRYGLFTLLFGGLLDAGLEKPALELFKAFLGQLERVIEWQTGHWNLLYGVARAFWWQSENGEVRRYPSPDRRDDAQHWVDVYLRHTSDHLRHARNAHNTNEFLTALAYLVDCVASDQLITLVDHCTEDGWLADVLDLQTARELLNALDHVRKPSAWWTEKVTQETRVFRHEHVDLVANQILGFVEHQIGRSAYFYELVGRAGMAEAADGTLVSRYLLELSRRRA